MTKFELYLCLIIFILQKKRDYPISDLELFNKRIESYISNFYYAEFMQQVNLVMLFSRNKYERDLVSDFIQFITRIDKLKKM